MARVGIGNLIGAAQHSRIYAYESEDIHIRGIDGGGGWRTGCGSHPYGAERVEEVEHIVWSDLRQKYEGEVYMTEVRPVLAYVADTWESKKEHENKLKLDKIINGRIRWTTKVREIAKKVKKGG